MHPMQEAALGGGPPSNDLRGGNKQDASQPGTAGGSGRVAQLPGIIPRLIGNHLS